MESADYNQRAKQRRGTACERRSIITGIMPFDQAYGTTYALSVVGNEDCTIQFPNYTEHEVGLHTKHIDTIAVCNDNILINNSLGTIHCEID